MSLTELATEILAAAKVVDNSLLLPTKKTTISPIELPIKSPIKSNAGSSDKSSFVSKFSKRSRRVAHALGRCLPLRNFWRTPASDKGGFTGQFSTEPSEISELHLNSFEKYDGLPENLDSTRDILINNCHRIRTLIEAPETGLINIYTNAITHFRIFEAIPPTGSATYAEIAAATKIPEDIIIRFIRISIVNGIFTEPLPGQIHHTPRSRWLLTRGPGLHHLIALNCIELAPAALRYPEAIERYGAVDEPEQSPFALANGNLPIFQVLDRDPVRRIRFGCSMQYLTSADTYDVRHILAGYDWVSIDTSGARALDVGGGLGQVSAFLAQHTKHIHFTVQDLPPVVDDALATRSNLVVTKLQHRVSFLPLSFLVPHPSSTSPYDVVILRWILHNWSDKYVCQIFRALIPAIQKGSRVFVVDYLLDEKCVGVDVSRTFGLRCDMLMGVGFGAKERTASGVRALMDEVAQEFGGRWCGWNVRRPECSALSFIEAIWDGI